MNGYELNTQGIGANIENCIAFCAKYSTTYFALQNGYVVVVDFFLAFAQTKKKNFLFNLFCVK